MGLAGALLLTSALLPAAPPGPLTVPFLDPPPAIDGVVREDEWAAARALELRYQTQPGDNAEPSERTTVWIGYDAERLYIAVRAGDRDPAAIRARVTRRGDVFNDDYVTVHLDTHADRRRAYVFSFNPLGIQADGLYTEGSTIGRSFDGNVDPSWDGVLESRGRLTAGGYEIEVAIPFRTLRYTAGRDRPWGLHVQRWIARKAENVSWQPISRDAASLLTQMGQLEGLTRIGHGRIVEVIPEAVGSITGEPRPAGFTSSGRFDPGVTLNWGLAANLTLSGTINPDYSQIEADVPQIEVNQRFPLRYPEKRPFFLEGGQYFASPGALNFVETRQIVDPDWGGKLTGKSGRNTVALLAAADRAPGRVAAPGDPAFGDRAYFTVGRYQRDVLRNSTAGGFLADHRFAGSRNTVAAADGQLRLPLSTVGYQLAKSWTSGNAGSSTGDATYVWYDLSGRHWRIFVNDLRYSGDYRSRTAFVRRTGIQSNTVNAGYEFQREHPGWWVRARPFVVARATRTADGLLDESFADPGAEILFARNVRLYTYRSFRRDAFAGREFDHQFNVVDYTVGAFRRLLVTGRLQIGEGVTFDPAAPQVGRGMDSRLTVTWKPSAALETETLWLRSRLAAKATGQELFDQTILRNRTNYQLTRDHGSRVIAEYNSLSRRLSLGLLYGYTPRPNTAIYLGYGDQWLDGIDPLDRRETRGLHRIRRTAFVKISTGWRR